METWMVFGIFAITAVVGAIIGSWLFDRLFRKPPVKTVIKTESFEIDPDKQYIWFVGELPDQVIEDLVEGIQHKYPGLDNILLVNTDPPKTILEF